MLLPCWTHAGAEAFVRQSSFTAAAARQSPVVPGWGESAVRTPGQVGGWVGRKACKRRESSVISTPRDAHAVVVSSRTRTLSCPHRRVHVWGQGALMHKAAAERDGLVLYGDTMDLLAAHAADLGVPVPEPL
jgi:hypothetical protein